MKTMKNKLYLLGIILSMLVLNGCQNKSVHTDVPDEVVSKEVTVTRAQFETGKMMVGAPQDHLFTEEVSAKGYVLAAPDGLAKVGVFVPGTVKNIRFKTGEWVRKGDVLFELTGSAIIQLQQDYAQNHARLLMAGQELERMQGLLDGNIVSQRDFQNAKVEFSVLKANDEALTAQLKLIHVKAEKVAEGALLTSVPVLAPMSSYISQQELTAGQYLEPQDTPIELVDTRKLQLNLYVFERDIMQLQPGQKVLFYEPGRKDSAYEATLSVVGKSINQETKTILCTASITNVETMSFVHGMYAECAVLTCERKALALPTEAVIKDGYNHYVLVKISEDENALTFVRKAVEIGRETLDYTEILTNDLDQVLISGTFNLITED
ncbi:MAG: efflux RND transporter periplasmic adaptor subunit [Prolixibacteraceae bacterium]|nr:efflux RND transporter periplasmic adaptor subunit [Prolixibacteraceae bacterium]